MGKGQGQFLGAESTGLFKSIITLLIVFQIVFSQTILMAADGGDTHLQQKEYSVFLPKELQALASENFLKSDTQFTENEKAFIEAYFNEPARVTLDLMILARALIEKADSKENAAEDIRSRESDREISVEIPGLGKAEFNSLGYRGSGKIFTRFVHYQTQTSYVYLDEKIAPIESLTEAEREQLGVNAKDVERARAETRGELERYTAIQQMHTKVHPEEYNPFPNLEELKPAEAKEYLEQLVENAKAKPKKKYDNGQKVKTGRLVKIITYDGETQVTKSIEEHKRYEDLSPMQRVKLYWKSIKQGTRLNWEYWDHGKLHQKPLTFLTGDVLVSLFSTVMQTGVFLSLKGFNADPFSILMVSGWAFAFSITPTFRNWINVNSSKSAVLFKSFLNSMVFNYIMLTAIHGADVVFSLSLAAFNLAFLSISNAVINNFGKVWWYKVPQMRQRAGLNLKEINIGNFKTKVDQSSLEQQAWYLGSNIFRTADLIGMGALFTVLALEFTWSRLAMLVTLPVVHYSIMRYAVAKDFKEKKELERDWTKYNYLHWKGEPVTIKGHKIPILYFGALEMMAKESWMIAKNSAMMIYWPGKVIFDTISAGSRKLIAQFESFAVKIQTPRSEASERRTEETKSITAGICASLFH